MIAVDWGTSSLRAWRLDDSNGRILDQRRAAAGILACNGRFEAALAEQVSGWDDAIVMLGGMIGSRQGWREAPYVDCPATPERIAAALMPLAAESQALAHRRLRIVPGLSARDPDGVADVMRGEETQLCGLIDALGAGTHTLCLPGTHSKWAAIEDGRITGFRTAMTGECYHVLRTHSILGRLMADDAAPAFDPYAFARGLARARRPGGLLHHAFGVRTEGLTGALAPAQLPDYLSGLLIGHELVHLAPEGGVVHLIGHETLTARYAHALRARGCEVISHGEDLAARGLWELARLA